MCPRSPYKVAFVWLFPAVCFQMCPQIACLRRGIITLVAFVWLFSAMCFQMACLRWGKVTLILAFLHCVFLSVYSNCVSVRMQSHLVTFVWLFSTVCFQMSPEMACHRGCILHRHIGCICLIFLHCVFSNVNRQSHIGCICLTFLQSTFSNEPSDGLPENLLDKKHWFPELPCVW